MAARRSKLVVHARSGRPTTAVVDTRQTGADRDPESLFGSWDAFFDTNIARIRRRVCARIDIGLRLEEQMLKVDELERRLNQQDILLAAMEAETDAQVRHLEEKLEVAAAALCLERIRRREAEAVAQRAADALRAATRETFQDRAFLLAHSSISKNKLEEIQEELVVNVLEPSTSSARHEHSKFKSVPTSIITTASGATAEPIRNSSLQELTGLVEQLELSPRTSPKQ